MRLLKGSITITDLYKMTRKELLARLEARLRSMKNEDKKQAAARAMQEQMEGL